jgi:hypothetical protein
MTHRQNIFFLGGGLCPSSKFSQKYVSYACSSSVFREGKYLVIFFLEDACFTTYVGTQTGKVTDHVTKIPKQFVALHCITVQRVHMKS